MDYRASTRCLLFASSLLIACADDGPSDDDVAGDTDDSTGTSEGTGEESSSGSTDADTSSTDDADTGESSETNATDDADSTGSTDESTADTTDVSDTTAETTDTSDTGEEIMCPGVFPQFDKSCSGDSDCAVVIHQTDCCGNTAAWGINEAEVDAFNAAEAVCDAQYPDCDCPSGATVAEDGNSAWDPAEFAAECVMGSCMSYVL